MIEPILQDVGRRVIYSPGYGPNEYGRVASFNEYAVFVYYRSNSTAAATKREHLTWES